MSLIFIVLMGYNKMRLTAQEIYDKLLNEDKIKTVKGQIRFHLGDVSIIVKKKDVVGNILQEWLADNSSIQEWETHSQGAQWKNKFKRSYKNHYGVEIDFPKWDEIKGKYGRK